MGSVTSRRAALGVAGEGSNARPVLHLAAPDGVDPAAITVVYGTEMGWSILPCSSYDKQEGCGAVAWDDESGDQTQWIQVKEGSLSFRAIVVHLVFFHRRLTCPNSLQLLAESSSLYTAGFRCFMLN